MHFEVWLASISFTQPCTRLINIPLPNLTFSSFGPNNRLNSGWGGKLRGNWPARTMHFTYDHFSVEGTRILGLVVRPVNTGNISPSTLDPAKNWNACLVKRARGSVHLSTNFHDIAYTRNTYVQKVYTRFQTSFYELVARTDAKVTRFCRKMMRKCFLKATCESWN